MGWFSFLITATPVYLFWSHGHYLLLSLATVNALVNIWSYGVMHNYAISSPSQRIKRLRENLRNQEDFTPERQAALDRIPLDLDPNAVPDWLAKVNLATTIMGILGIVTGVINR